LKSLAEGRTVVGRREQKEHAGLSHSNLQLFL
jgi:hypothetical protein